MTRRGSSGARAKISQKWLKILRRIPNYDPVRDSKGYWFDTEHAQLMLDFFPSCLQFVEGEVAGQPFVLEPWDQAVVANLFGWKSKKTGLRRYRTALIFVPRGNIKTTLGAGLVLAVLFCDGEPRAQCFSAATDQGQASLAFDFAKLMVAAEPELDARCKVYRNSIVIPEDGSFYKALSSEKFTKHGLGAHFILSDELHAQPSREFIDILTASTVKRSQPLVVHITTSDYERPDSLCNELHDHAHRVIDGLSDPSFLPVIYEADRDCDWTDPKVWAKANPMLGKSVKLEYLEQLCKGAQENVALENIFRRWHLNIRTEQAERWIPMDAWRMCGGEVDSGQLKSKTCYGGLDLASTSDITCLVLAFPVADRVKLLPFYWVPVEVASKRDRRDRTTYEKWIRSGHIRTTEGSMTDYAVVRRDINEIADHHGLEQLAVDRLFQGAQLAQELQQDGLDVVAFGQGFMSMAAPTLEFDTLVRSARLEHGDCPILAWMAGNVSVEFDAAGNMKPSKKKSSEKIDGIVSAIMALALCMKHDSRGSVYSDRGLITL